MGIAHLKYIVPYPATLSMYQERSLHDARLLRLNFCQRPDAESESSAHADRVQVVLGMFSLAFITGYTLAFPVLHASYVVVVMGTLLWPIWTN